MSDKELIVFFKKRREDFSILKQKVNGFDLVYADNGATTQKPQVVIDKLEEFYLKYNSNIHRSSHSLAMKADVEYEKVRDKVAEFINCDREEVVFTKGATDSLNMIAFGLEDDISKGDEIVLSEVEHHANLVPWQEVAKRRGAVLKFIPVDKDFRLDLKVAEKLISKRTKIVSLVHVSNVTGSVNDVTKISEFAKKVGALFVVDVAQSIAHLKVDVKEIGCDLMAFSAHKMVGPTGVGVLFGKREVLQRMKPLEFGGDMIDEVSYEGSTFRDAPYKFEAGTPNIADVVAFGSAIDYLKGIGMENIERYESILSKHFLKRIDEIEDLELYGSKNFKERGGVFAFNFEGIHSHDVGSILDKFGIASRSGHHCVMPFHTKLGISSSCRVSFALYNTIEEVDFVIDVLKKVKSEFEKGEFLLK